MGGCLLGRLLEPLMDWSAEFRHWGKRVPTSTLGEDHTEDVSKSREGNKDRQDSLSTSAKHISEECGSDDAA